MITHPDAQTNIIFAMLQEARDEAIIKCGNMGTEMERVSAELTATKAELEALKSKPAEPELPEPAATGPEPVVPAPAAE